jgi:hypothetical protein
METKDLTKLCPTCDTVMTYESVQAKKRGDKENSKCTVCRSIFRNPNVIKEINQNNKFDFSAGEIIRYVYEFPVNQRNEVAINILNLCNPNIHYKIEGQISSRYCRVAWSCNIHPKTRSCSSFRNIVERKQGCVQCKGQNPSGTWTNGHLISEMKSLILKVYQKTNLTLTSTSYFYWDSKLLNAWFKKIDNPSETIYRIISELKLPDPTTNLYIKDGKIFRGFREFVGYCLIQHWNVPFEYSPKVFDNYYSDGYFIELNTHWEHWGELNKNNSIKKTLYDKSSFGLFETFDKECRTKGIEFLYNTLRDFLISNGYKIPVMTHSEILDTIKGNMSNFENIIGDIITSLKNNGWDKKLVETELRPNKEGNIILSFINKFFNCSILNFKEYLNTNYGFQYKVTAKRGSYNDINHFIKIITPIVKELGYVPTQKYFAEVKKNDIPVMASRFCGGLNNLRRNEVEEGEYYFIVKDILGDNAPYDRDLVWKGDKFHSNVTKVLQFYKDKGLPFPKVLNHLRNNEEYLPFGPALHTQISRKNCGGWNSFVKQYSY